MDNNWHYRRGNALEGPITTEELSRMIRDGRISLCDQVSNSTGSVALVGELVQNGVVNSNALRESDALPIAQPFVDGDIVTTHGGLNGIKNRLQVFLTRMQIPHRFEAAKLRVFAWTKCIAKSFRQSKSTRLGGYAGWISVIACLIFGVGLVLSMSMPDGAEESAESQPAASVAAHEVLSADNDHSGTTVTLKDPIGDRQSSDLNAEMKKVGFTGANSFELFRYCRYGSSERFEKLFGLPNDISGTDQGIYGTLYHLDVPVDVDQPGAVVFGDKRPRNYASILVPFRVHVDPRDVRYAGKMLSIAGFLANHREGWKLLESGKLQKCGPFFTQMKSGGWRGSIYLPEASSFSYLMIELSVPDTDVFVREKRPKARLVFDSLGVSEPGTWGLYEVEALNFHRYDCAAILRAFDVGLEDRKVPEYFPIEKLPPWKLSASLRRIDLVDASGNALGTAVVDPR